MTCTLSRTPQKPNVIDFATRRPIGEGALYLDIQDGDEFHIPTYLEMKLGCNQSARGSLSPSRRRAGVRARRFRLPPGAKRWADAALDAILVVSLFAAIFAIFATAYFYSGY